MRKGFSTLLIIILIVFLALPVLFWIYSNNKQKGDTKGAVAAKNGATLYVTSNLGTWDLEKYLCETKADCLASLDSGNKLETVSGGETQKSSVYVSYFPSYSEYKFMKIFVRPSWNSTFRNFKVINKGEVPNTEIYNMDGINVVLFPLENISKTHNYSVHFSD